jgi:hypothetical protein
MAIKQSMMSRPAAAAVAAECSSQSFAELASSISKPMAHALTSSNAPAAPYASWKRRSRAGLLKPNILLLLLLLCADGAALQRLITSYASCTPAKTSSSWLGVGQLLLSDVSSQH